MRFLSCIPQTNALYKFFDDDFLSQATPQWTPALDIIEEKDRYVLKADLPGIKKEDIKVSLEDNVLMLEAERKSEAETKEKQFHSIERSYGLYRRTLNLGQNVDANKIQASYKDGVLELVVPKAEEVKPKAIDIKVE